MLCRSGQVKLLDLGLAKFHAERRGDAQPQGRLTQPGVTMGTIDYMAPEQWENSAAADIRADIYSLGCTLFFLLTGKPPYGDPAYDTSRKKLMAHVVAPIPSLVETLPRLPPGPGRSLRDDDGQGSARALRGSGGSGRGHGRIRRRGRIGRGDCRHPDRRRLACREQRPIFRAPRRTRPGGRGPDRWGPTPAAARNSRRMARQRFRRNVQSFVFGSLAGRDLPASWLGWRCGPPASRRATRRRRQRDRRARGDPRPRRRWPANRLPPNWPCCPG